MKINGGVSQRADGDDGVADGTSTLVATCNAAGTAWEVNGVAVTNVECTIREQYFHYINVYLYFSLSKLRSGSYHIDDEWSRIETIQWRHDYHSQWLCCENVHVSRECCIH